MSYVIAIVLGLTPSVIWLALFDQEDRHHREPLSDIIYAFILGAFTTFFALAVQMAFNHFFQDGGVATRSPLAVTVFATIEEVLKWGAVWFFIHVRRPFDEPLDAMIYMLTVALGFAAVENVATALNQVGALQGGNLMQLIQVVTFRFLGATLLHTLTSAIVGFHWAVGLMVHTDASGKTKKHVWWHIIAGLVIASLLHTIFNYLIIRTGPVAWAIPFVIAISFFVLVDFEKIKFREQEDGFEPQPAHVTN